MSAVGLCAGTGNGFDPAVRAAKVESYTWHCNRHTFASRLVMAGVDLRTVAQLMGHRTIQMTMRYAHLAPDHQQSAVERLLVYREKKGAGKRGPSATKTATGSFGVAKKDGEHENKSLINNSLS